MPYISGQYYPIRRIVFFLGEGALIFIAIFFMHMFFMGRESFLLHESQSLLRTSLVTIVFMLCLYFFDLYDLDVYSSMADTATRMTQAFGFGCIILAVIYYLFPSSVIPTRIFLLGYLLVCVLLALWRFIYITALNKRLLAEPIIMLGSGKLAADIADVIMNRIDAGYQIAAFVGREPPLFPIDDIPFYKHDKTLTDICLRHKSEIIVAALDERRGTMPIHDLINCKLNGVRILAGISFFEKLTGKIMVERVNPDWIIYSSGFSTGRLLNAVKRGIDILLASLGLILSAPIMLASAIIIKLESPGPVFYLQTRVGLRGKNFKVIKFRSMRQDAESNGAVWAAANDNRVTRFGGFARQVRIDELPQLWNVLKGEMSFVGPRPERPVFVEILSKKIPYYSLRHNIKPGVTGWAQICYPYGASEEDALRKLEFDLYYLKNISLSLDSWIIFKTIKTVLFRKGGR
ncbi:MAG TPA: TIGR03013 family PEP-CTERM/XrtA system glycosyltransferase [Desulfobacterales bacterium]|nr:TIGR03013 family PEP-CTERM/XrtA system glycosyltransferase [Desulfobacterales bacterium]